MVAIFTGAGTGFERGSGNVVGGAGLLGSAAQGRGGDNLFFNAATGNLLISRQDEFLVGRGPDVGINRTYNSLGNMTDDNGDNWRQGYDRRVFGLTGTVNTAGSTIKRRSGDGSEIIYSWLAAKSAYVTTDGAGAYDTLTFASGTNKWTWTDGDSRVTEVYASAGSEWRIESQSDTSGNSLTFTYDGNGRLTRVTTANGEYTQFGWSGNNLTEIAVYGSSSNLLLTRTRYTYDASNRLITVAVDKSPSDSNVADGKSYVTSYSYHGTTTRVATISQTDGSSVGFNYYGDGRLANITQRVTNGISRTTTIAYGAGYTEVTTDGQTTRLDYNADGSLKKVTAPPAAPGASAQTVQFGYNANGDLISVTDAANQVTGYAYDGNGNVVTVTDRMSSVVTRTYGAQNQLLTETRTGTSQASGSASLTTRYVYDAANRLVATVSAEGRVTRYAYDVYGQLTSTTTITAQVYDVSALAASTAITATQIDNWYAGLADKSQVMLTERAYDARGNLDWEKAYSAATTAGAANTSQGWSYIDYLYDQAGQLLSRTAAGLSTETYVYDGLGRTIASTDLGGAKTTIVFDDAATTTLVSVGGGMTRTSVYNKAGELISTSESPAPVVSENLRPDLSNPAQWVPFNLGVTPSTAIAGQPAYLYTVQTSGQTGAIGTGNTNVRVGDTIIYEITLKEMGALATHNLGIYGTVTGWGAALDSSAEIISGPGTIAQSTGGLWSVAGLSTTTETRVRIKRTFTTAEAASSYIYVGGSAGGAVQAGADLIVSAPSVQRTEAGPATRYLYDAQGRLRSTIEQTSAPSANLAPDLANTGQWSLNGGGGTRVPAGTLLGSAAYLYTVTTDGSPVATSSATSVVAGDEISFEITLQANGPQNAHVLGMLGTVTGWGDASQSSAEIISGPGTVMQYGGLWELRGVSTTQATRIRITRRFTTAETATVYVYAGEGSSLAKAGDAVILAAPSLTKTSGYAQHILYDNAGRMTAQVDHTGAMTEYRYDANNRVIATTRYANKLTAAQLAQVGNPNSGVAIGTVRPAAHADDLWAWTNYDAEGRVTRVADGVGSVTRYSYDASGQRIGTVGYINRLSAQQIADLKTNPASTIGLPAAHANDAMTRTFYDKDGRAIGVLDGMGYLSEVVYDKAGRKVQELVYANPPSSGLRATGTFDQLRTSAGSSGWDRTTRYVYDGQGLLRFTIDSLNQVVGYVYSDGVTASGTTHGQVRQTIAYGVAIAASATYTVAGIETAIANAIAAAAPGTVQPDRISYAIYDSAGRVAYAIGAEGLVTSYSYNTLGQVTRTVVFATANLPAGLPTKAAMDSWVASNMANTANRVTRSYYNGYGDLVYAVDAEGHVSETLYDPNRRVSATRRWSAAITPTDSWTTSSVAGAAKGTGTITSTILAYDHLGRVERVADALGTVSRNVYSATGLLTQTIVAEGTADAVTTAFTYDATGRVLTRTDGHGTSASTTTAYEYDGVGNLLKRTVASGTADEAVTAYEYDVLGRLRRETLGFGTADAAATFYGYDSLGNIKRIDDARGNSTFYYHDKLGRVIKSGDPENHVSETKYTVFGEVAETTRRYNKATNVFDAVTQPAIAPHALDAVTRYEYDRLGRVVRTIDAGNYQTETDYTVFGEIDSVTKASATTSFEYDKLGQVTKSTDAEAGYEAYTYDAFGRRLTVTNKLGGVTSYTYDSRGLLTQEAIAVSGVYGSHYGTQATTIVNTFSYDLRGNLLTSVEAAGSPEARTTTYSYDALNRVVTKAGMAVTVTNVAGGLATATATPTERYVYDERGNVIETRLESVAPGGATTLISRALAYYDDLNRTVARINPLGAVVTYDYDENGNLLSTRAWDTAVTLPTTPGGTIAAPSGTYRETSSVYDKLNRLTGSSVAGVRAGSWNGTSFVSSTGTVTTTYLYDAHGNVIQTTDANGNSAFAYYDALGRKTAQVDQELYLTTWTHDANGNVLVERRHATKAASASIGTAPIVANHADDRVTQFAYDLLGRRTQEKRIGVAAWSINASNGALTAATGDATINYSYNALGLVASKQEANGDTTSYTYDNAGRLIVEQRAGFTDFAGSAASPTVRYFYDRLDQLTSTRQGVFETDIGDRVSYNDYTAGRLTTSIDAAGFARIYHYDLAGHVVAERYERTLSNGSKVNEAVVSAYDAAGQVVTQSFMRHNGTAWVNTDASGQTYVSTHMRYNAHGEITGRGMATGLAAPASYQEVFDYDAAGRMWRTNSGDGVVKFMVYDKAGNQTLSLTSTGGDLSALTAATYLNSINSTGDTTLTGAVTAINVYDKRGMVIQTREPDRQLSATASTVTITRNRTHNAFGETTAETDARGYTTNFTYNTMGRLTRTERPTVSITLENGTAIWVRPSEDAYYDISGRLIGHRDANGSYATNGTVTNGATKAANTGNLTTRLLLAGTGHGGSEALTSKEFHADQGVLQTSYDRFGDVRIVRNELGSTNTSTTINSATDEQRSYDKLGRLTQVIRRGGTLKELYQFDELGQRTQHWIEEIGTTTIGYANVAAYVERTDYDAQGRVTSAIAPGGDTTTTTYAWDANLSTSGLGTFGGWVKTTSYLAIGKSMVENTDMFGHAVGGTGMDGTVTTMSYDQGARLVATSTNGGAASTLYTWLNTGLISTISAITGNPTNAATTPMQDFTRRVQTSTYDANGNKLTEHTRDDWGAWHLDSWDYSLHYNSGDTVTQNATATYDALNRMVTWDEAGNITTTPAASITQAYDAVGNIRRINASYRTLDAQGNISTSSTSADRWYLYDSMNRVTLDEGALSGGTIVRGANGRSFIYDLVGNRIQSVHNATRMAWVYTGHTGLDDPVSEVPYTAAIREDYTFDAGGRLLTVRIAEGGYSTNRAGVITPGPVPTSPGGIKASFTYDALGRQMRQIDWLWDGATAAYDRQISYNSKGQVAVETVFSRQGSDTYNTVSTNYFTAWLNPSNRWDGYAAYGQTGPGTYMGGIVTRIENVVTKNGDSSAPDYRIVHEFVWGAGGTVLKNTTNHNPSVGLTDTWYTHDAAGVLTDVRVQDSRARTIFFTNDVLGQVIFRKEVDGHGAGDPHEAPYRFAGREIGGVGNNGTVETDYQTSIDNRTSAPGTGAFRGGGGTPTQWADFGRQIQPYTSFAQGEAGGVYTVRDGDSLHSIAAALWGDSALWYHLAEANGLSAGSALVPGQTLTLPAGIQRSSNSASTFKPYDPAAAIGDVSPGSPTPKKNNCGVIGAILIAVVAIAVTAILKAPVAKLFSALGKALGGAMGGGALAMKVGAVAGTVMGKATLAAIGNIAGQGFGIITGLQQGGFNWKAVGTSALFAMLPGVNVGKVAGSQFLGDVISGAINNALGQGAARLVGLQDKFDWAGVAAAGVGAGVGAAVGGAFGDTAKTVWAQRGQTLAVGMARSIASAATRSLATGTSFGDNIIATLPDVIGNTIGSMAAKGIASIGREDINSDLVKYSAEERAEMVGSPVRTVDVPASSAGGGESWVTAADEILVTGSQFSNALYRPGIDNLMLMQVGGGGQTARNPRVRMGHNGGPPLEDWRTLRQVGVPRPNGPEGAIFGVLDNLFDFTGPALALQTDLLDLWTRNNIADILAIDPGHRFPDRLSAGGSEGDSLRWKIADYNFYESELAATKYIFEGDIGALQNETLRVYQGFVDRGFAQALGEAKEGTLFQPEGWSRAQALGTRMDKLARDNMDGWFREHRINPGRDINVAVNSRLSAKPEGSYTVPDIRVGGVVFDASISPKNVNTFQVQQFYTSPKVQSVFIVRPTSMGGSYFLPKTGNR